MKLAPFLIFILSYCVIGQNMAPYSGGWEGTVSNECAFSLKVEIEEEDRGHYVLSIFNSEFLIQEKFSLTTEDFFLVVNKDLTFKGRFNSDRSAIRGFFRSGLLLYHVHLERKTEGIYAGDWNILMVEYLENQNLYLSIENATGENFEAYPVFGDNRFTGTWCSNFLKSGSTIFFTDFKTGLQFKGELLDKRIDVEVLLNGNALTKVKLKPSEGEWKIGLWRGKPSNETSVVIEEEDNVIGVERKNELLEKMEKEILEGVYPNTHSVLVAMDGKKIYENYLYGYKTRIPHDQRSASKSVSSAVIGLAIDEDILGTEEKLYNFLPDYYQKSFDSIKSKITIHHLLTMSSGLDAIDFGIERTSVASEDNFQPTPDWSKTILNAPMIYAPGSKANYGSANPYLLGVIMDSVLDKPVELFMDEKLFEPLGISGYIIQTDMTGRPYFAGGMYLTPPDMLKFGQLYLNNGVWNGRRIISEEWVEQSYKNYFPLENTDDKNGYGYLWWHHEYLVEGRNVKSVEARGAGGQYIVVIQELQVVVVITSGNYNNGKTQQPEELLEKFILPFLLSNYTSK